MPGWDAVEYFTYVRSVIMAVGFVARRDVTVSERVTFAKRIGGIRTAFKAVEITRTDSERTYRGKSIGSKK